MQLAPIALLLLLITTSCTQEVMPQTADETVKFALNKIVQQQDPGVVWDLLPASYQADMQSAAKRLAETMPGTAYDKVFKVIHKIGILAKTKDEDLLSIGPIRFAAMAAGGEEKFLSAITSLANVAILLSSSEVSSLEKLRAADLGQFAHATGARMWTHGSRALAEMGRPIEKQLQGLDYELVSSEGDQAKLKVEIMGRSRMMDFQRVEGRWVPSDLVSEWTRLRPQIEEFLVELKSPETAKRIQAAETQLDTILAQLQKLEETTSRTAFVNEFEKMSTSLGKQFGSQFGSLLQKPK